MSRFIWALCCYGNQPSIQLNHLHIGIRVIVFIKFITKYLRPLGMFILFTFAVLSIFAAGIVRDLDEKSYFSDLLDYSINFENRFYDFRIKKQIDPQFK